MAAAPLPPTDPRAGDLARKRLILTVVIGLLVLAAVLIAVLPSRIPLPFRLLTAATDLVAAVVLATVLRQKFSGR